MAKHSLRGDNALPPRRERLPSAERKPFRFIEKQISILCILSLHRFSLFYSWQIYGWFMKIYVEKKGNTNSCNYSLLLRRRKCRLVTPKSRFLYLIFIILQTYGLLATMEATERCLHCVVLVWNCFYCNSPCRSSFIVRTCSSNEGKSLLTTA